MNRIVHGILNQNPGRVEALCYHVATRMESWFRGSRVGTRDGCLGASTFGERLRDHRRAAELTQEELAERAGLSRRTISDLERGLYLRPHLDTVRLLARALALESNDEAVFLAAARQSAHGSLSSRSASASRPTNLPDAPTSFVGRAKEVAAVVTLVQESDGRLVTLTGPGGTGETRLALQVGNALLDKIPGRYLLR